MYLKCIAKGDKTRTELESRVPKTLLTKLIKVRDNFAIFCFVFFSFTSALRLLSHEKADGSLNKYNFNDVREGERGGQGGGCACCFQGVSLWGLMFRKIGHGKRL